MQTIRVRNIVLFFLLTLIFPAPVFASPVINEISTGSNDDWIEIYNPDDSAVDLSLYRIRDATESNKLDLSGVLDPKAFIVFLWSNKLNNSGDIVKLVLKDNETVLDQVEYGNSSFNPVPAGDQTLGRKEDGRTDWVLFSSHSKGQSNNAVALFYTPTPSPTPTPTTSPSPTPTRTPTPTKSGPTPTKIPTPTKTPISTKSQTPTPLQHPSITEKDTSEVKKERNTRSYPTSVLGTQDKDERLEKKKTMVQGVATTKSDPLTLFFVVGGILLLIICGILIILQKKGVLFFRND